MGFRTIVVIILHQGMEAPLALAFKKAAAELAFELALEKRSRGWWGERPLSAEENREFWSRIHVRPLILPAASPPASGDHGGYYETSFLLATRPELVDQGKLDQLAPWYCHLGEEKSSATAHAEQGRTMVEACVRAWVEELQRLGP